GDPDRGGVRACSITAACVIQTRHGRVLRSAADRQRMTTLTELCEREAPLPWQRALDIARALAMQPLPDRLLGDAIVVDGDQVTVAPAPPTPNLRVEPVDDSA